MDAEVDTNPSLQAGVANLWQKRQRRPWSGHIPTTVAIMAEKIAGLRLQRTQEPDKGVQASACFIDQKGQLLIGHIFTQPNSQAWTVRFEDSKF